jgi:uncharacterized OsmC-like protein
MKISARVENKHGSHRATVETDGQDKQLPIAAKTDGYGSAVNGGELLFLALATCYCNDIYREAAKRGIDIRGVHVDVRGDFGAAGEPARNIEYRASVESNSPRDQVLALMRHTDTVAEIQNTLRQASTVLLAECDVKPAGTHTH